MAENVQESREDRRKRRAKTRTEAESQAEVVEKGVSEGKGRPTPSRRKGETVPSESSSGGGNFIVNSFTNVRDYLGGVRSELEKVTWPTTEETRRLSYIVGIVLVLSSLILGGLSILFTELFNIGVNQPLVFLGVFGLFLVLLWVYGRYAGQQSG